MRPDTVGIAVIGYRAGDVWVPHLAATEALQPEAEHFIACIRNGETPLSDGVSGLEVVETLEATTRSIAARGPRPADPAEAPRDPAAACAGRRDRPGHRLSDVRRVMTTVRLVHAVHGARKVPSDPAFEDGLSEDLRQRLDRSQLLDLFDERFSAGHGHVDALMRRAAFRALARGFGEGVTVGRNVNLTHPETMEIGAGVFIGDQAILQGRFDGHCVIGQGVWLGPQSYFDARDLEIGDHVGWGPGAKVLGSTHTGLPVDVPIVRTDLAIAPVRISPWADVGVNAIILPGVTVGRGSMIGAGAVVTKDVPDLAIVAGAPARVIGWRDQTCAPHRSTLEHAD